MLILCSSCLLLEQAPEASGQTFSWTNTAGGTFGVASNWSPAGGPPNSSTESAIFGLNSLYTVTFTGNVTNQNLTLSRGFVGFASNSATLRTYTLTSDASVLAGLLVVGGTSKPISVSIADQLTVADSQLDVSAGSQVSAARMSLADSAGAATILISGAQSTFNITGTTEAFVGSNVGTAMFHLESGAAGTFNGALTINGSGFSNRFAEVDVVGGSTLTVQSNLRVGAADAASQIAQLFVSDAGSRLIQNGAHTIDIGGPNGAGGGTLGSRGLVAVANGATFTTGTSTITLNAGGGLEVSAGVMNANGPLTLNHGTIDVDGGALFANVTTRMTGGTLGIGNGFSFPGAGSATFASSLIAQTGARINLGGGSLLVSGGSLSLNSSTLSMSAGTMSVAGTATIDLSSDLELTGGAGTFNGSLNVGTLSRIGVASASITANGIYQMSGGTLSVGAGGTFSSNVATSIDSATISVTSGVAKFPNFFSANGSTITVSGTGSLTLPATPTFTGTALTLSGSGTISTSATFTLALNASSSLNAGIYRTAGGTLSTNASSLNLSELIVAGVATVGQGSTAQMGICTVGDGAGAGTLVLDGAGTSLNANTFGIEVGLGGNGTLDIRNQAAASGDGLSLGGNGSLTTGRLIVETGGVLTLTDGVTIRSGGGVNPSMLSVIGPGSRLVGNNNFANINGTVSISNSGSASLDGTITISSSGIVDLSSGTFDAGGSIILNGGIFRRTGGTFIHDVATIFEVNGGGTAEFLNGVHVMRPSNIFHVFNGTLRFGDGVQMGGGSGTGSILLDGATASMTVGASGMVVGSSSGGRGTLELRNGAIATVAGLTKVGDDGSNGTFIIQSGAAPVFGDVQVGVKLGTGSFNCFGNATPTIGNLSIGLSGTGIASFSGASVAQAGASSLSIGSLGFSGRLDLAGGTFSSGTGTITVSPGGTLNISSGRFVAHGPIVELPNSSVAISGPGQLDLTNQPRFIDYNPGNSPIATVQNELSSGFASGAWNGPGIISSTAAAAVSDSHKTAIGYAEASSLFTTFPATFLGRAVDSNTLLMRYTLYGDANLDTTVDTIDFNLFAANFSQSGKTWFNGDFNYNGTVDTLDFNLLASNFSQVLSAGVPFGSLVPEPTMSLVAAGTIAVGRRRRCFRR